MLLVLSLGATNLPGQEPSAIVAHGFLATGGETYLRDGAGKILWRFPHSSRDVRSSSGATAKCWAKEPDPCIVEELEPVCGCGDSPVALVPLRTK